MTGNARVARAAGCILSALVVAFRLLDGGMKLVPLEVVVRTTADLGYPPSPTLIRAIGLLGLACALLYAVPRTAVLGAVLLTAYMGGAVATHVRVGSPLFSHVLFGVYLALLAWGGLFLRDPAIRALLPLRKRPAQDGRD